MKAWGAGFPAVAMAGAMAACLVAPAHAADLPAPASAYFPPTYAPAVYPWTGLYFGGNVGGGLLWDQFSQVTPGSLVGTSTVGPTGLVGGGQVGVNFQFSSIVVGAEAAWSATNLSGTGMVADVGAPGTNQRFTSAPLWIASATGRLGYAANDWLFYAKGGGAWMQVGYTQDTLSNGIVSFTTSTSDTRSGFTAGVGIEYGLTEHFSARVEYDYYGFGTKNYNFLTPAVTPIAVRSDLQTFLFGVNYRFTWGTNSPIVSR